MRLSKTSRTRRLIVMPLFYGAAISAAVAFQLSTMLAWQNERTITFIALLFGASAAFAMSTALIIGDLLFRRLNRQWLKTLLMALAIICATAAVTALVLGLEYRLYFSQWHAQPFSRMWIWQQVFTFAGSTYQYVVLSPHYYGSAGLVVIFMSSILASRKTH